MIGIAALLLASAAAAPPIDVQGADFVLELTGGDGTLHRYSTTSIPYIPTLACYRWVLWVKPVASVVPIHERMTLPAPAAQWGVEPDAATTVSKDRRSSETDIMVGLSEGIASNGWCVAEGDPQGTYSIEVSIDGKLLRRFDFTVGTPPR